MATLVMNLAKQIQAISRNTRANIGVRSNILYGQPPKDKTGHLKGRYSGGDPLRGETLFGRRETYSRSEDKNKAFYSK